MRIVVSGTHASGKSTLISDFSLRHPGFTVMSDPFDLVDETHDGPGPVMFAKQLRIAADRLISADATADAIAERSPLDFFAYLLACGEAGGASSSPEFLERAAAMTLQAMSHVDLLVVLPLAGSDAIAVSDDEYPDLRLAMNDALLDLVQDTDLIGARLEVAEIVGTRDERLAALESLVDDRGA